MKIVIGQCNNTDCSKWRDGICTLHTPIGDHKFQYDHDTGLLSCQWFIDNKNREDQKQPIVRCNLDIAP